MRDSSLRPTPPIERQTAGERWTLIQTQSNLTSILRNPGARSSDYKGGREGRWGGGGF